jgi:hypothetical protein
MAQKKLLISKFNWRFLTWPPVVTFFVIFAIYLVTSLLSLDPDFGWHLQAGNYILSHGVPATDIFTYTAKNFPWVDHEWLGDTLLSIMYSGGGYVLLSIFYSSLWTLSAWLVGRKVHNLTIITAVLATVPFSGVRAITWSVLGLALLFVIVNAKSRRIRWVLPILFLVWANFHGSFVIGFAYLLYMALKQRSWGLFGLTVISVLVTLINPYGPGLYVEVLRTLGDSSLHFRISEWAPFYIPWMTIPYVLVWLCAFAQTDFKNWRKYLGIDVLFFLAGVSSMRNLVLFVIISVGVTDTRLRNIAKIIPKNLDKPRRRFIVIIGIIITLFIIGTVVYNFWGVSLDRESSYPKNAVSYLLVHPCSGNLFNDYNYGGYLIWKLPSEKVYIDGRMPSWVMDGHKYMDEYISIRTDSKIRNEKFKQYNIKCALINRSGDEKSIAKELIKDKWTTAAADSSSLLLLSPK